MIKIEECKMVRQTTALIRWTDTKWKKDDVYDVFVRFRGGMQTIIETTKYLNAIITDVDQDMVFWVKKGDEESDKAMINNVGDNHLLAIAGNYFWQLLNAGRGIPVDVKTVRKTNERCSNCYDPVLKKVVKANCPVCGGTGYIVSYDGPYRIYIAIKDKAKSLRDLGDIMDTPEYITAWTNNDVKLKKGDIITIVNDDYVVNNIPDYTILTSYDTRNTFLVKQDIILRRKDVS